MEVSWNGGNPSRHPFSIRIFHEIHPPAWGSPMEPPPWPPWPPWPWQPWHRGALVNVQAEEAVVPHHRDCGSWWFSNQKTMAVSRRSSLVMTTGWRQGFFLPREEAKKIPWKIHLNPMNILWCSKATTCLRTWEECRLSPHRETTGGLPLWELDPFMALIPVVDSYGGFLETGKSHRSKWMMTGGTLWLRKPPYGLCQWRTYHCQFLIVK